MSLLTPIQVNLFAELMNDRGLAINADVNRLLGSAPTDNYIPGQLVNETILKIHLQNTSAAYGKLTGGQLNSTNYQAICNIGLNIIPALGNTFPTTYTPTFTENLRRFGFVREVRQQANVEFAYGGNFKKLVQSFNKASGIIPQKNRIIASLVNSLDFMRGVYSSMNDLVTSDVTAVNRSPFLFGRDLIATGRTIDLQHISEFGKPSRLLQSMHKNNAISNALSLCLQVNDITSEIVDSIVAGKFQSIEVERNIYVALSMVTDVTEINQSLLPLNCQLTIDSLADLLNVKKLFPNSYMTMVFPDYDTPPTNGRARRSVLVYTSETVNSNLKTKNLGEYLQGIISNIDVMTACGAFSYAMQQIKRIESLNIEQFSQVVMNLETLENVPNIDNNLGNKPLTNPAVAQLLPTYARGSDKNGLYRMSDFFGAMSGAGYKWNDILQNIKLSTTTNLTSIYNQIAAILAGPGTSTIILVEGVPTEFFVYDALIAPLIVAANNEVRNILNTIPSAKTLNELWKLAGYQLFIEQRTRLELLDNPADLQNNDQGVISFVDNIAQSARDTSEAGSSVVLDGMADKSTTGGQALFSTLREIRNNDRIQLYGGEVDSLIPDTIDPPSFVMPYTPSVVVVNNQQYVKVTGDPTLDSVANFGSNANFSGSTGGSQSTTLVPKNLDVFEINKNTSVDLMDADSAIREVSRCCCD